MWIPHDQLRKAASLAKTAFGLSLVSLMSRGVQLMARLAEQLILLAECECLCSPSWATGVGSDDGVLDAPVAFDSCDSCVAGNAGSILRDSLMEYVGYASLPWISVSNM